MTALAPLLQAFFTDRLISQHADQIVHQIQRMIAEDRRRPVQL